MSRPWHTAMFQKQILASVKIPIGSVFKLLTGEAAHRRRGPSPVAEADKGHVRRKSAGEPTACPVLLYLPDAIPCRPANE